MTLRLRNTLTRAVEPVEPVEPVDTSGTIRPLVRMYTCGPTVYRYAHIGNLRSFMLADLIRRALVYHGVEVLHVKNITDVGHMRDERFDRGGDRILVQAELEGRTAAEIADHYEAAFHADEAAVNILPAHRFPRATDHIDDMIRLAERLEDLGCAYATPKGTVYYDVSAFPGYGQLSRNTLDELRAGHRGEVEPDKHDPADFALWKGAEEGRMLRWPTRRWGEGFPGWHLECSAMSMRYLGERFEIHTGGVDNIFPHHEDEIAQSASITGQVPARLWVHGEHLLMQSRKMAKSAGNVQRVTDLAAEGIDPLAFRYLVLTSRYRHKLDLSAESLVAAASALDSLRSRLRALGRPPDSGEWTAPPPLVAGTAGDRPEGEARGVAGHSPASASAGVSGERADGGGFELGDRAHAPAAPLSAAGRELHERVVDAIDEDLDLPVALAAVRETLRADLSADERRWLVLDADAVLGLDLNRTWDIDQDETSGDELPADAAQLLAERDDARAERDYERADSLRDELAGLGIEPIDRAEGPSSWRRTRR